MLQGDERFAQFLGGFRAGRKIEGADFAKREMDEGLQEIVDVVAAEVRIAVGGKNLVNVAFAGGDSLRMEMSKVPPPRS